LIVFAYAADGTEPRKRLIHDCRYLTGGQVISETWTLVRIPLVDLQGADREITRLCWQDSTGDDQPSFSLDEIRLVAATPRHELYPPLILKD